MTRSHRNEDRGGEHRWTFNGVEYPTRKLMCEARRAEYVRLLDEEGMNFTQAAHAVGVSKRTGKAWRNGRTRATGRNEKPLVDWYRSTMDKPKTLHPRYLSQEERIQIADRLRLGDSIRAIARLLGRDPGTVSREVERNRNPESGGYEPYRAQQKAADRLKRPKPRKAAEGTRLWDEIAAGLRRHWSPEQIANRLRLDFPDNGDMHACLCSISCCGFSHDDFSGLGRACRPRNGLNWMVLVSPPERTGKDYDQHAPSTVYPSFAAERGIRRVDRAENTCQRADGA